MEKVILFLIGLFCILNFILILGIGIFLVRFRDRVNNIFSDLIMVFKQDSFVSDFQNETKTWDEKYEEEIEAFNRRLKLDLGLRDLPDPKVSWGQPPAPKKQEGLIIQDRLESMK